MHAGMNARPTVIGLTEWRMVTTRAFTLTPHPGTSRAGVAALTATLERTAGHWLLRYELSGDIAGLRLPAPSAQPAFTDGLWRHTCFEVFIGRHGDAAYSEFNFSPSGDWAAYAFSAERVRAKDAPPLPAPRIACEVQPHRLTLRAWLPAAALPQRGAAACTLGLCAVIEDAHGQLGYWALHHPGTQPDFHHRGGWTARPPALAPHSG